MYVSSVRGIYVIKSDKAYKLMVGQLRSSTCISVVTLRCMVIWGDIMSSDAWGR